jgi:hypothetical protein
MTRSTTSTGVYSRESREWGACLANSRKSRTQLFRNPPPVTSVLPACSDLCSLTESTTYPRYRQNRVQLCNTHTVAGTGTDPYLC